MLPANTQSFLECLTKGGLSFALSA